MKEYTKKKHKERKEQRGDTSYSKSVRATWFRCAFKLGFFQSSCKASPTTSFANVARTTANTSKFIY